MLHQRAASKRNLVKARAARKRAGVKGGPVHPMGKSVIGYHHTSAAAAKSIARKGFQRGEYSSQGIFFSNRRGGLASSYGHSTVRVRIPRKAINFVNQKSAREFYFAADPRYITNLQTRRKANAARKAKGGKPITTAIKVPKVKSVMRIDNRPARKALT